MIVYVKPDTCNLNAIDKHILLHLPGCIGVHAVGGAWGIISVGLFAKHDKLKNAISVKKDLPGLFYVSLT